ncbi:hypothetical protein B0H10DRAFT_2436637 [Mycena sp. CBHHK59/15]|nr:hypothetical protein B0H10DRAFT_2436637 [Mycena sp. CBHHK59/15]
MSAGAINELMQNWAARPGAPDPPFADHEDLYNTIDATEVGHVPWESFTVRYNRPIVPDDVTPWKTQEYVVHFRDPRKPEFIHPCPHSTSTSSVRPTRSAASSETAA